MSLFSKWSQNLWSPPPPVKIAEEPDEVMGLLDRVVCVLELLVEEKERLWDALNSIRGCRCGKEAGPCDD